MNKSVYLAGPITGLTWDEATSWRVTVHRVLAQDDIVCYSPLRAKTYLSHLDGKNGSIADSYPKEVSPLSTSRAIYTRDKWDATRCGVLMVNFLNAKKVSIGTVLEIAWANAHDIPIVLIMEDNNVHQHSMVKECAGYIVPTLQEGIDIIRALFVQE